MRHVIVLESTGSTNDDLRRLAADGAPEGTVVLSESQTFGRGRLGHTWESPARLGLYASVLVRPEDPPDLVGRHALAAAVAVAEASRSLAGDRVVLKWPNDVLADGRKLAGILAEVRQGPTGPDLVLGIGINVGHDERDFSPALAGQATSLRILRGAPVDRETVAVAVLQALALVLAELRAQRWPEVAERFLRYAPDAIGRRVRTKSGDAGVTCGLDASGALRIATDNGVVLAHASESVSLVEE